MAEIQKKIYIKGPKSAKRVENLQKIADEKFRGNFSAMTNYALDKCFGLDPETGYKIATTDGEKAGR